MVVLSAWPTKNRHVRHDIFHISVGPLDQQNICRYLIHLRILTVLHIMHPEVIYYLVFLNFESMTTRWSITFSAGAKPGKQKREDIIGTKESKNNMKLIESVSFNNTGLTKHLGYDTKGNEENQNSVEGVDRIILSLVCIYLHFHLLFSLFGGWFFFPLDFAVAHSKIEEKIK